MSQPEIFYSLEQRDDGIAHLQLNRPERMNTMSPAFFPQLRDTVRALDEAGQTRVLVISSTGKHFSAGMALDTFAGDSPLLDTGSARSRLAFQASLRKLMDCFSAIDQARFPVLCAVQGGCIGGALDLAAACDMRYCTAEAFFSLQEINIGMAADLGVLQRLQGLLPQGVARELAYLGERFGAERALQQGLVNAVLPDHEALLAHVLGVAAKIAAKSPLAMAGSKLALNHARDHGVDASLAQMSLLQSAIFDTEEMGRAILAWKTQAADAGFAPLAPVAKL
ncbi:enoyl-CoA hydratase-related protein [Paucibacter sp. APW11]|uniref:Enoyl-CoA hydratase-related protein n=1 Tax=Roseateles aquae TaxID=3077235 RepID=A0ABU3PE70_9BURK|nr:enoyl-CoA hydratase-related protein [Paucibacter sp. APW11]MDT9000880.1 enoyl-CoA hydratase-related protein [Paucibacter sp. APW11]